MKTSFTSLKAIWPATSLAASIFLTGCVGVVLLPVSTKEVHYGHRLQAKDVAFIKPGVTTRAEVIAKLGTNYLALPNQRAIAYSWEMKGGGGVWWWFIAGPGGAAGNSGSWEGGWRTFFLALDDHGVVRDTAFKSPSTSRSLHRHMDKWLAGLSPQRQLASTR
jgi:hypothetical protein